MNKTIIKIWEKLNLDEIILVMSSRIKIEKIIMGIYNSGFINKEYIKEVTRIPFWIEQQNIINRKVNFIKNMLLINDDGYHYELLIGINDLTDEDLKKEYPKLISSILSVIGLTGFYVTEKKKKGKILEIKLHIIGNKSLFFNKDISFLLKEVLLDVYENDYFDRFAYIYAEKKTNIIIELNWYNMASYNIGCHDTDVLIEKNCNLILETADLVYGLSIGIPKLRKTNFLSNYFFKT